MKENNLIEELKNYLSSHSKEELIADWQNICDETKDIVDESTLSINVRSIDSVDYIQIVPQIDEEKFKMFMTTCSKEELAKMLVQANKTIEQMEKSFNTYSTSEKTY